MVWTLLNLGLAGGDIQKLQNNLLSGRIDKTKKGGYKCLKTKWF
jgi:hypothetical protein